MQIRAGGLAGETALFGRSGDLQVFADLLVFLDPARKAQLDELAGAELVSDTHILAGTAQTLADQIEEIHQIGYAGVRLRPGVLPTDLTAITDELVPELQRRGRFRTSYAESTLRERLGLAHPASRYAHLSNGSVR